MTEVIRTTNLCKDFGHGKVVSKLSITVNKGEIYGFLGLNGAGKTTTIRMMLGLLTPTSGKVFINQIPVTQNVYHLWKNVGYLIEVPSAYPDLTVRENLHIFARMRLLKVPESIDDVIEKLQLSEYESTKACNLSQGNFQRLGIAKAIIHNPEILILDEPSNALDPAGIVEIREMLVRLAKQTGVTVFISSHILSEMAKLATRIGIIHKGELIKEFDSSGFNPQFKKLTIKTLNTEKTASLLTESGFTIKQISPELIDIYDETALQHPEIISKLLSGNSIPLTMMKIDEDSLESFFLRITSSNPDSL
jgi:ABC-2 type transport system ATP-binding protein